MSANKGVEVKQSQIPGAGKGLFARVAFSPGDVVVAVDRPLVAELEAERMQDTCAWCFQRGATDPVEKKMAIAVGLPSGSIETKNCTGCRKVGYCSRVCQSKAWKREHKYECKILARDDVVDLPPEVRGAVKVLGRLVADPDNEFAQTRKILGFWPGKDSKSLSEFGRQNEKKYTDINVLGRAALLYCGNPEIEGLHPQTISSGVVANIMINAMPLASVLDDVPLGMAFDPLVSSANHSCDPNARLVFNQPQHEIRALRKINAGEEIFISYTEPTHPFGVRQAALQEYYYFTCRCTKCEKGVELEAKRFPQRPEDLGSEYRKLADKLVSRHESELSKHLVPGSDDEAQRRVAALEAEAYAVLYNKSASIDDVKGAIQMCIGSKMWSWTSQPVAQLCRRLGTMYLQSGMLYEAFRLGVKLHLEILPGLYPQEFHPDRLVNAWSVSTLINVLCNPAHEELYQELSRGGLPLRVLYFGFLFYLHELTPRMFSPNSPFAKVTGHTYDQIMAGVTMPKAEIKEKLQAAWPSLIALANNVTAEKI
ncbi:hypothetical protein F5Y01DRAFT_168950 [Xylaria sp. FL0043]|nr:hypothetical protein F5Y01DRAFT_168950 [Xylaria sp. FL0043]